MSDDGTLLSARGTDDSAKRIVDRRDNGALGYGVPDAQPAPGLYRSTLIGSTRDARRTGPSSAIEPHTSSSKTATPSVIGSNGCTP